MHLNKGPEPTAWGSPDGEADVRVQRPRPRLLRELVLVAAVVVLYVAISRGGGMSRDSIALAHGRDLLGLERFLHIDVEPALNAWLAPRGTLSVLANYEYAFGYVTTSFGLLIILYLTRSTWYRWARSSFLLINLIGISIFAIYPATPPRLLPGEGFVDTVTAGKTFGSWGSPLTADANHLAAMPSLHVGWALWFSIVVSSIFAGKWWVKAICGLYVCLTTTVIMATANHYILDAVGGALVTLVSVGLMAVVTDKPDAKRPRLAPADAFVLLGETLTGAAQHAGGVVVLRDRRPAAEVRADVAARLRAGLDRMPRFRHRVAAGSFWRRPRWEPTGDLDWDWHLPVHDVARGNGTPGGPAALAAFVAAVQGTPLPRDRPLWRCWTVSGVAPGEVVVVFVAHRTVADGLETIFELCEPRPRATGTDLGPLGAVKRAGAVLTGIGQLAREGQVGRRLPVGAPGDRDFALGQVPTALVEEAARAYGVAPADLLRSACAGALRRMLPAGGDLQVGVRVTMPAPTGQGIATTTVPIALPLAPLDEVDRLRETVRRGERLRSGTRARAVRFLVGTAAGGVPPPVQRRFAQVVHGKLIEGVVADRPGPSGDFRLAGSTVRWVYPVVPPAPGTPLAIGVLGWDRCLDIGVSVDPALGVDAHRLAAALVAVIDELSRRSGAPDSGPRGRSSEEFGPFWPVFREEGIPVRKDMG
ncbi:bifunctional phosphatase PAP2/O-acyltransferase family protein [Asanoa siamensis]|uniref:Diacylglycerol O-acyltransferase n=1 Tax=Asanoa siamensis TaxID=926357 RepID=A0ABQ4CS94_9ACTN|nr:phosphatase PAP2 family protein [Asanoa siamensis]GIF73868.1 hypothetical protein Asi02nite_33860 [Asanoa siamensis]